VYVLCKAKGFQVLGGSPRYGVEAGADVVLTRIRVNVDARSRRAGCGSAGAFSATW
jgi:hypothetical protein